MVAGLRRTNLAYDARHRVGDDNRPHQQGRIRQAAFCNDEKHDRGLRTWDSRSQVQEPIDRNFRQAFGELNRLKDKLAISDAVIEKAAYIYRKALGRKALSGSRLSTLIASSLYSCRDTETPRNLKDVEQAANIKKKDIARCYRLQRA